MKKHAISAATRVFAILGDPVAHSLSPLIHNAAMRAASIDAVYVALRAPQPDVAALMHSLAQSGGGGNVTLPHKGLAADIVDKPSARVRATHACNTFWLHKGRVHGENTDVLGFRTAVRGVIGDVGGTRVLLLGAGGGARAVLYALLTDGCSQVTVLARDPGRLPELEHAAGSHAGRVLVVNDSRALRGQGFDLVVNATPLGIKPNDRMPLQLSRLSAVRAVYDIVYQPHGTRWVKYARALGLPAADGTEMLLQQAAAAFELWFEQDAPLRAMRAALGA